jgi:hypothetical protein
LAACGDEHADGACVKGDVSVVDAFGEAGGLNSSVVTSTYPTILQWLWASVTKSLAAASPASNAAPVVGSGGPRIGGRPQSTLS